MGLRRCAIFTALAIALGSSAATAKPKPPTKDESAARHEQKAVQTYVAGDAPGAVKILEQALHACDAGCSPKTRAHLHLTLGTVKGAGENDYGAAKRELVTALTLDPEIRLSPALANAQLNLVFEEARVEAAKPPEKPAAGEKPPEKPVSVSDLIHGEDPPPPPPKPVTPTKPTAPTGPEPRWGWLSARAMIDLSFISDANVCAPGAPSNYACTDENGARYGGRPQPNDDISSGFALSTGRLVLGYERLLFGGLTVGAFAGFAFGFGGVPEGRSGMFPLHLEARGTYTFGDGPYVDGSPERFHPFVFGSVGLAEYDTTVTIRVYEIPCEVRAAPACRRDLDAHRRVGKIFTTIGGGIRYRIEKNHALRAAVRTTIVFDLGSFVVSPELTYEFGI
jgi:hypothetical protein